MGGLLGIQGGSLNWWHRYDSHPIRNCRFPVCPEIIIISGYVTTDVQADGKELGISVYLNKPFNLFTLFNGIMTAFGKELQHKHPDTSFSGSRIQLCNARVLLVEDDKVNQIVAQEIMKRFGAEVVVMDNGVTGVDAALGGEGYDMVFMDIQMPEMNGYDAATAIRQVKGELELPIIAMTAHAFSEERERCLAAGMNDHISKPIDPDQLYSVMLKWLPAEKVNKTPGCQKTVNDGDSPRILPECLPGIEVASVLQRCGGNETLVLEIILSFRNQHRNTFNKLRSAVESGNILQVKELVHNLKGLAGTVGATSLGATLSEFESVLRVASEGAAVILPAPLEQQLEEVFAAADTLDSMHIGQAPAPDWIQLPKAELEPLLKEFYGLLLSNSLGAKKLFEQVKQYLRQPEREEIWKQMVRLDFEKAAAVLELGAKSSGINL